MKKILLSQRIIENSDYPEWRDALDVRWGSLAGILGFLPVPMMSGCTGTEYFKDDSFDGLILTGGNDLSRLRASELNSRRDEFESSVTHIALEKKLPILGVCKGMQFLAELFGSQAEPIQNHVALSHEVQVHHESRFRGFDSPRIVNSFHQYGFWDIQDPLRPLCKAPDGSIEAFEHESLPVVGIMWHPERGSLVSNLISPAREDLEIMSSLFRLEN